MRHDLGGAFVKRLRGAIGVACAGCKEQRQHPGQRPPVGCSCLCKSTSKYLFYHAGVQPSVRRSHALAWAAEACLAFTADVPQGVSLAARLLGLVRRQ